MICNPHGSILPLQRTYFYGFRPKNVRFCIGGRTVLGRRTYGFGTETVKRSLLHAEIHLPEKASRPTRRIKKSVVRRTPIMKKRHKKAPILARFCQKRKEQTKNNKNRYCVFF